MIALVNPITTSPSSTSLARLGNLACTVDQVPNLEQQSQGLAGATMLTTGPLILEEFSFIATQITILGQVYRLKGPHEGQVWGTPEGRSG
ncbi:hypothetical protein MYU51_005159 [Penicillium brevicompactum]